MENKEFSTIINTDKGQASYQLPIVGKLDSIIIESSVKVEILIESELGYIILHRTEHFGSHYYCIRSRTTTPIERLTDYAGYDKFNLNENVIITIRGRKNEDVRITLRLD